MTDDKIYFEARSGVKRSGKINMVTAEELTKRTGFQSVYGVGEEAVEQICKENTTRGIRNYKLYSDILFLDIDNNDTLVPIIQQKLVDMGASFKVYHTGNRGHHFHIPIEPMYRTDTPYRQKRFAEYHFNGVDLSLYKTTGMIRLEGTYHTAKPGKRKVLTAESKAGILKIDLSELPVQIQSMPQEEAENDTEGALDYLLMQRVGAGGRNNALYKIAFLCQAEGYTTEEASRLLTMYNETLVSPPVRPHEITTLINSAYRG